MEHLTISQIKEKLHSEQLTKEELCEFKIDDRKGVQKVVQQYEARVKQQQRLREKFADMLTYEEKARYIGKRAIAGIDEAGRGPLAGPVVAGAVILPKDFYLEGLNDSKKLSLKKRESFFEEIKQTADYGIGMATNEEIDQINIYQATKLAMKRAVSSLSQEPDHLLIDAMTLDLNLTQEKLIKGDQRSVSIAAASIMAKVTRDRYMAELDNKFPRYHFKMNQGYGTSDHLRALKTYGAAPCHRTSFAPVRDALNT